MELEEMDRLSPFAKFHVTLSGYKLFYKSKGIAKYVVWDMGCTDAQAILDNKTPITFKKKAILGLVDLNYLPNTNPSILAELNGVLSGIHPQRSRK